MGRKIPLPYEYDLYRYQATDKDLRDWTDFMQVPDHHGVQEWIESVPGESIIVVVKKSSFPDTSLDKIITDEVPVVQQSMLTDVPTIKYYGLPDDEEIQEAIERFERELSFT